MHKKIGPFFRKKKDEILLFLTNINRYKMIISVKENIIQYSAHRLYVVDDRNNFFLSIICIHTDHTSPSFCVYKNQ